MSDCDVSGSPWQWGIHKPISFSKLLALASSRSYQAIAAAKHQTKVHRLEHCQSKIMVLVKMDGKISLASDSLQQREPVTQSRYATISNSTGFHGCSRSPSAGRFSSVWLPTRPTSSRRTRLKHLKLLSRHVYIQARAPCLRPANSSAPSLSLPNAIPASQSPLAPVTTTIPVCPARPPQACSGRRRNTRHHSLLNPAHV